MKKIILACLVLAGACNMSLAQSQKADKPVTQQPAGDNELLLFGSKANELDASLQRNNTAKAQQVMPELTAMMQNHISRMMKAMEGAKDSQTQADISRRVKSETLIANEVKQLSGDLSKNGKVIVSKLKAFIEVF